MIELKIEGMDRPLDEKRDFFLVTDDADGELAGAIDLLSEVADGEFETQTLLENVEAEDGSYAYSIKLPDEEVGEVIEVLSENWPKLELQMDEYRRTMLDKIENEGENNGD